MKDQEYFERIESYINGTMSDDEKVVFEKELHENPGLAEDLKAQEELQLAVEMGALQEDLDTMHEEHIGNGQSSGFRWLAIAAGIAVLFTVGVYFMQEKSPSEELFASYSTSDPGLPVPMSSTTHYLFYDAMVDYKSEKYQVAIDKWKGIERAEPKNDTLNYYIGAAHYNLENYELALSYFDKVSASNEGTIGQKAEWYSVLARLKTGDTEGILGIDPIDSSKYRSEILEIQKSLEK